MVWRRDNRDCKQKEKRLGEKPEERVSWKPRERRLPGVGVRRAGKA